MALVRLGYVRTVFPTLEICGTNPKNWGTASCTDPGFYVEIWKDIAQQAKLRVRLTKTDIYGDELANSPVWDGMMGMIESGYLNASLELMSMTSEAMVDFKFSLPVQPEEVGFVVGVPIERSKPPNYFVYDFYWIYLYVLILLGIGVLMAAFKSCQMAHYNYKDAVRVFPRQLPAGFWSAIEQCVFSAQKTTNSNPFFVIGFVLISISYYSGFRGQRSDLANVAEIQLIDIQRQLTTGAKRLVIDSYAVLSAELNRTLYPNTSPDPIVISDYTNLTQLICTDSHTIFYGDTFRILNVENAPCVLETLDVPDLSQNLGYKALIFSKSTSSQFLEIVNEVVLKIYGLDRWDTYWLPRYYPGGNLNTQTSRTDSLKLSDLSPGFILWSGGVTVSVAVCLLERIWYAHGKKVLRAPLRGNIHSRSNLFE